jgi:hypothetical protein
MSTSNQPTVEELNAIQAEWMKLDPHAPTAEKRRVFALMERYPRKFVSGHDGLGVCMVDGQPTSMPIEFQTALNRCKEFGGRTDVAWNGKLGKWYSVATAVPEQHKRLKIGTRVKLESDVYRPGIFTQDGTTVYRSEGHVVEHLANGGVAVRFDGYAHTVDYTAREAAKFQLPAAQKATT